MIYFLINNNYHYYDLDSHLSSINKNKVSLIEIPHTLDERKNKLLSSIYRYKPIDSTGSFSRLRLTHKLTLKIAKEIKPKANDILFIYTEYELLNQFIVSLFRKAGTKVYIIEDGGLGTYVPFRISKFEPLTIKQKITLYVYRKVYSIPDLRFKKINGVIFNWMPDDWIDGVCTYFKVPLKRPVHQILLHRPLLGKIDLIQNTVVFLNEPIYQHYQSLEAYFSGLKLILAGLCSRFEKVWFKFHPRETLELRESIRSKIMFQFSNLYLIEENVGIELLIDKYRPTVAASYFCSALLSMIHRGIEPVYLYHLIPEIAQQPIFLETTEVLKSLNYNFISSFSEIPSNYNSGLLNANADVGTININELL